MDYKLTKFLFLAIVLSSLFLCQCSVKDISSQSSPISHETWNDLLQKNVKDGGKVDYKGFIADKDAFYQYLELLNNHHPNHKNWNEQERLAYWINAYNAYTVQLIVENYPIASIKDIKKGIPFINSVWDLKFITIEGQKYDLNNVEHSILRKKFNEPRIHFAINCASISCPNLRNEAYIPSKLDVQLEEQAHLFLGDPTKNTIAKDKVELSKIFSWFGKDFKKEGNLIDYIQPYTETTIDDDADVSFGDYDWSLNE